MKKTILLFQAFLCLCSFELNSQTISNTFFAQNYWMPNRAPFTGQLQSWWPEIQSSGVKYMRIGGKDYDGTDMWSLGDPSYIEINAIIDEIQAKGIIPIIQVPIDDNLSAAANASICADYVDNINNTNSQGIVYWEIGNEPDGSYSSVSTFNTTAGIESYIKTVSTAMKGVTGQSSFIKIIGPSLSYYDYTMYHALMDGGANDITGSGPNGYYIDVIAFNTYPFQDEAFVQSSDRNDVISYIKSNDQYEDILDDIVDYIPAARIGNLKIAITEANVSVNQDRLNKGASGIGPGSFIGGQYWADFMGESLEWGVEFVAFWSVVEGTSGNNYLTDIGYISSETSQKRSSYWHYHMMANNFAGTFLNNDYNGTLANSAEHKAFGYVNTVLDEFGILIMNQSLTYPGGTNFDNSFTINFNNTNPSSGDIRIKINESTTTTSYSCRIKTESTSLLIFDATTGLLKRRIDYSIDDAKNNLEPKTTFSSSDAYIADGSIWGSTDNGVEPYYGNAWDLPFSDDIWIRNYSNSGGGYDASASGGLYSGPTGPLADEPADWTTDPTKVPRIFVRVRNKGCGTAAAGTVEVYCIPSTTVDVWNTSWTYVGSASVLAFSGPEYVCQIPFSNIGTFPNPGTASVDYCFVARFVSANDPMFWEELALPVTPYTNSGHHIKYNNNYAQDNKTMINTADNSFAFNWGNISANTLTARMDFNSLYRPGTPFTDVGIVKIDLGPALYAKWVTGGKVGSGVIEVKSKCHSVAGTCIHPHLLRDGTVNNSESPFALIVTNPEAFIGNITLGPNESYNVRATFNYTEASNVQEFYSFDIREFSNETGYTGAMRYVIKPSFCDPVDAGKDQTVGRGCKATLTATPAIPGALYSWYDNNTGVLIDTGRVIQVSPLFGTTYEVQVKNPNGCIVYDSVRITVQYSRMCPIKDYALSCPVPGVSPKELIGYITSPTTLINDTAYIRGTLTISSLASLTLENMIVVVEQGGDIKVNPGGKLVIRGSVLSGCSGQTWGGITVTGNNTDPNQVYIEGTQILHAAKPLTTDHVQRLEFLDNVVVGDSTGIYLKHNKEFIINGNYFEDFAVGVQTFQTLPSTGLSQIKENYFLKTDVGLSFKNDNHATLSIECNLFDEFAMYGIYSKNTTLKNQGSLLSGAGNAFINSTSTMVNAPLYHNGVPMTYYYDPLNPISLTTNLTLTAVSLPGGTKVCDSILRTMEQSPEPIADNDNSVSYKLYPNPNTGAMTFDYELAETETGVFLIYDMTGRIVAKYSLNKESKSLSIKEEGLQNGLYFYSVIVNGITRKSDKLIIIK
jgi:hypothetical protein